MSPVLIPFPSPLREGGARFLLCYACYGKVSKSVKSRSTLELGDVAPGHGSVAMRRQQEAKRNGMVSQ